MNQDLYFKTLIYFPGSVCEIFPTQGSLCGSYCTIIKHPKTFNVTLFPMVTPIQYKLQPPSV